MLVLFDIDGTLIRNAGRHHKDALIEGIRRVTGRSTSLDGVATQGMLDCDLIRGMLGAPVHVETMPAILAACQDAYVANCAQTLEDKLCPGVVSVIEELRRRGAALGLVTGNLSAIAWKKMELARLRHHFQVGAFAEHASTRAELAGIAARQAVDFGLVKAGERISLIGDHENDVRAARSNGFQSIAVATGFSTREELAREEPDILVDCLAELDLDRLVWRAPVKT